MTDTQLTDPQRETLARAKGRKGYTPSPWYYDTEQATINDDGFLNTYHIEGYASVVLTVSLDDENQLEVKPSDADLITDAPDLQDLALAQDAIIKRLTQAFNEQKAALDRCVKLNADELKANLTPTPTLIVGDEILLSRLAQFEAENTRLKSDWETAATNHLDAAKELEAALARIAALEAARNVEYRALHTIWLDEGDYETKASINIKIGGRIVAHLDDFEDNQAALDAGQAYIDSLTAPEIKP